MNLSMHNLRWLIRREFAEHRRLVTGGFWLMVLIVGLNLLFVLASLLSGSAQVSHAGDAVVTTSHQHPISVLKDLSLSMHRLDPHQIAEVGKALAVLGYTIEILFAIAFAAAIVSYGLGCMYDERRDRSVLFWKSLPVSDAETVGAKLIFGLVLLLVSWTLWALATAWLSIGIYVVASMVLGVSGAALAADTGLGAISVLVLAALPVYLLSLAPAFAWLLFCSTIGGRQRALMAFLIPAFFALVNAVSVANPFWHLLIVRLLPIGFFDAILSFNATHSLYHSLLDVWQPLTDPWLWLGVLIAAVLLIASALYRRRYTVLV